MLDRFLFARHLEEDEVISSIVHKHWLIGFTFLFWPIMSIFCSWFALVLLKELLILFYLSALWAMASLVWFLRCFFDYYLDAWIVTSQGIIDLEWHGWFHRQSSRILLSDIQGVSYEVQGILGTLLRFGTVSIEKISTGTVISLPNVSRPRKVEALILKNMEAYLHAKNLKDAKHVQELLAGFVAREVQIRGVSGAEERGE